MAYRIITEDEAVALIEKHGLEKTVSHMDRNTWGSFDNCVTKNRTWGNKPWVFETNIPEDMALNPTFKPTIGDGASSLPGMSFGALEFD